MGQPVRIVINGFGLIGRCAFKQLRDRDDIRVVAVNDLADLGDLAYLLKYDSVHGWYERKVEHQTGERPSFTVDDEEVRFFSSRNPAEIPWGEVGADIVLEATGVFRDRDKAAGHLDGGAKRVIISAPSKDADGMFVLGVNHETYDRDQHVVVSMASCTTNCLAPVAKVLHETFGVEHLLITTVHAYTASQSLMDRPVNKRRRGRAAAVSIVPTTTGATAATGIVYPPLAGRMDGLALRVPVPDGSITDIVATLETDCDAEAVNAALTEASEKAPMEGILRVTHEALVSRDILGDPHSSIVSAPDTMVLRDRMVKVLSWYDNEWGYSARLTDFAAMVADRGA